jgi:hypothetical protein
METNLPIDDLASWQRVDPGLMVARLKPGSKRPPVGSWIIARDISPVDLYVYLKARFGPPNGFGMALKKPGNNNLLQWHWSLQSGEQVIEFMGYNLHAVAAIDNTVPPSDAQVLRFIENIKSDFATHGPTMAVERKRLEKWTLFINPYRRLTRVVVVFRERLAALKLDQLPLPDLPFTPDELEKHNAIWDELQATYTAALGIGVTLRLVAPVWAESFVNLLIFVLAKDEYKNDDRLYQSAIRAEIDVRVKTFHLNCEGFKSPVNTSSPAYKAFQTLMNGRNDFLHGNIDPNKLKYGICYFDGHTPLPTRYESMAELALGNSLKHVEPAQAINDVEVVESFIELVLSHLKPAVRKTVIALMMTDNPGWREDRRRLGVLFPPEILHSVMGDERGGR